jgi:hypothetical protein
VQKHTNTKEQTNMTNPIELCKQTPLSEAEKKHGARCMDCNKIMTNDPFYYRRKLYEDVNEIICIDCGRKGVKTP